MSILLILQAAVTVLTLALSNPQATVEQKATALQVGTQAIQVAQEYLANQPVEHTGGGIVEIRETTLSQPQPSVQAIELTINPKAGSRYEVNAVGDNITLEAVVVAIRNRNDREVFYPNSGVLIGRELVGIVARLQARECQAVKPSYSCPGKEIETSEQYQALEEMGYHNKNTFTLIQGESYFFEIPESARIVYVKGKGERSGAVIEKEL